MRLTPASASSRAYFGNCEPLVVRFSSSSAPLTEMAGHRPEQPHDVLAHVRLAAGDAELAHALGDECRAETVKLLERQKILLRQKRHVLGHALDAVKIAAIGDRHAQVRYCAAEGIDHRRLGRV
jgi:hypothetical protein